MEFRPIESRKYQKIQRTLKEEADLKVSSPGRINLIGEHVDYNGGTVLPAAINRKIYFYFKKNNDFTIRILSKNYDEGYVFSLQSLPSKKNFWIDYLLGVITLIINEKNLDFSSGFDCLIESNLPSGAGISSSAALLCGFAKGINWIFSFQLGDIEIVKLCQKVEKIFSGANVGIMDHFSVMMGERDHFLLLDSETLKYQKIKSDLKNYSLVLFNSKITHSLGNSPYNERRRQCENALLTLQKKNSQINSLAEVNAKMLKNDSDLNPIEIKRVMHVVQEEQRVKEMVIALGKKDFVKIGNLLNQSHKSLRDLYSVSCKELDFLAQFAEENKNILGGRIMGGGFGGCTINLIPFEKIEKITAEIQRNYLIEFGFSLEVIPVSIGDGVKKHE